MNEFLAGVLVNAVSRRMPRLGRALDALMHDPPASTSAPASVAVPLPGSSAPAAHPPATPALVAAPASELELLGRRAAYAHWGEDLVVSYLLDNKRDGFYVDVGCFHPTLFSNTKLLFDAGWRASTSIPTRS